MYHYIHKHIYIDIYIRRLALLMGNIYDWLSLTLRSLYVSECFWSFIWFYVEVLSGLAANHSLLNHVISNPILLYTWCPANVSVSKFGSPTTRTSWILKLLKNTQAYDFEVCYGCPMRVFFQMYSPSKRVPSHGRTAGAPLIASLLEIFVKELRIEDLVPLGWQCGAQHAPAHHDINGLFCSVSLKWSGSRFLGSLDHHSRPVWFLDTGGPTRSQSLQQNLTPNSFFPV